MNGHLIENEKQIFLSSEKVRLGFVIPEASDFFDGHFPVFKILPAVAQTWIAVNFADKYFGTGKTVLKIKRMKFVSPVLPDANVELELVFNREKETVTFTFYDSEDSQKTYSAGSFTVSRKAASNE
ncbi:MAG: hydroxymyristoyl-ACP dehydratase [Treponema sp.]|nr:hydroxymyristoyl-ACP dehydratase [Treponema sp.]